jgi:LacI family transcriptional regulator
MAEYLAGLKHRDIGFILGNENQGASIDRLRGFKEAVRDFKLRDNPEWVRQGDFTFESGERCMEEILSLRKRPTAVFASNDDMAAGALLVAHRRGYSVPGDLSVVGFDDISLAQRVWPPLTTVRQPIKRAAAVATGMLLESLRTRDFTPVNQEIPGELVVRESAAPPSRK